MDKVAIFGKKGSIAKYDLVKNKPVWVGDISLGYKPNIIGQFEDYIIVFSSSWSSKMVHCFKSDNGDFLWSHYQDYLHSSMIPFIPISHDGYMYFLSSSREISKMSWKTGKIKFRKRFKKSMFNFNQYFLVIISGDIILVSKKDALIVDKDSGDVQPYSDLGEKLNLKEITAALGDGTAFMSSIYLTHPNPYADGTVAGGDGGGGGGD